LIDYIASILVRLLNLIFRFIPISAALWIGRRIGSIVFVCNKKRRLIAYANLKAALGKEKAPSELKKITKRVYQNMAQTFVEILSLTKVSKKYIDSYVEVINLERMEKAVQSSRGIILLTGHFGNWELANLAGALHGYPIMILAREQKMKRLNELLNTLRESKGCKVIRKGITTRNILKALYDKQVVGILADQDAGKQGVFLDFFGRPASTPPGAMAFAKKADAVVIPNFIVRVNGPHHKLFLEERIDFRDSPNADIVTKLQKYISILEKYVRMYPDQWLWLHKRWKSTPVKTVLVLDDGKQGHLNQSLAVAKQIQNARANTQGYKTEDTKIVIVRVGYASRPKRLLLTAASICANWRCHGCMRCMRFCLDRGSYDTLMGMYCDFVVSCGTSLSPINVFISRECNAKSIAIMSPGPMGTRKFDLAILPKHDNPAARKNVLVTETAPNLIEKERGSLCKRSFIEKLNLDAEKPKIGLLIGGDTQRFTLSESTIAAVLDGILKASERLNGEIFVTTSRRTAARISDYLKQRLFRNERCKLLVVANEENPEGVLEGILSLSDIIVVSGESISMISEAINASKPVLVFKLEKKGADRSTKHEAALKNFASKGYVRIVDSSAMAESVAEALKGEAPSERPKDMERIYEAVRRLI